MSQIVSLVRLMNPALQLRVNEVDHLTAIRVEVLGIYQDIQTDLKVAIVQMA